MLDGEFSFTLTETTPGVEKPRSETVKNDAEGNIKFTELSFDKIGDYTFKIEEEVGFDKTIKYDKTPINVLVRVSANTLSTKLTAEVTYVDDDKTFENVYVPEKFDILISKQNVNGENLEKAELSVYRISSSGEKTKVETWITSKNNKILNLAEGRYEFVEDTAPEGYAKVDTIIFVIDSAGLLKIEEINGNKAELVKNQDNALIVIDESVLPKTMQIKVAKMWQNIGATDANLLTAEFTLYANGNSTNQKLSITGNGEIIFDNLDIYDKTGNKIEYSVVETELEGFKSEMSGNLETGLVFTNTKIDKYIVRLLKIDSKTGNRLQNVVFELFANKVNEPDKSIGSYTTDEYGVIEVTGLDEGTYYFIEKSAPAGYKFDSEKKYEISTNSGDSNNVINITVENVLDVPTPQPDEPEEPVPPQPEEPTPQPEYAVIRVEKQWVGDTESNRPESIAINLVDNVTGQTIKTEYADKNSGWSAVFTDVLIKDADGKTYEYRVEEIVPEGYIVRYDGMTIINELVKDTPVPPETNKEVFFSKKTDEGKELSAAVIQLLKSGEVIKEWITDGELKRFELESGDYIFREITAPFGYYRSTDISFTINKDGDIVNVMTTGDNYVNDSLFVMVDEKIKVYVEPEKDVELPKTPSEKPNIPSEKPKIPDVPSEPTVPLSPVKVITEEIVKNDDKNDDIEKTDKKEERKNSDYVASVKPKTGNGNLPKTGDGFGFGVLVFMTLLAGCLSFIFMKKRNIFD